MSEPQPVPRTASALTTSIVVHACLLIAFAAVKWVVPPKQIPETVAAGFAVNDLSEAVVTLPKETTEPTTAAGGLTAAPVITEAELAALPVVALSDAPKSDPAKNEKSQPDVQKVAATTSKGAGQGTDVGDGVGEGGSFFDPTAMGDRVVYVVDCSKSMNRPYPSPERTRFGRVKRELLTSIKSLRDEQRFFVIYFNTEAHPMPARRLVPRSSYDVPYHMRWLTAFQTDGKTNPEPALVLALQLKPDAIFFLTDGAFRPNIVDNVVRANLRAVPVHAIAFGDDVQGENSDGIEVLEGLATRTGGRLTLISDEGQIIRR